MGMLVVPWKWVCVKPRMLIGGGFVSFVCRGTFWKKIRMKRRTSSCELLNGHQNALRPEVVDTKSCLVTSEWQDHFFCDQNLWCDLSESYQVN